MYINKLHLRAFGKFINKRLYFENRFNIIYGENEAGKSTVHNFIEAVLYGFDEDEETSKYDKYKPWNGNLYKGSIGIRNNSGEKYLVSKDFLLGTTQVFKKPDDEPEMHEEDITCPGDHFFNMNKISFRNTVSVRQLGNKTERELATELKNKIMNLSETRDETISIDRILQRLNIIKEEAGNENNDKTLLGQYTLRLRELEDARENSLNAKRQVMFLVMEKKRISGKIQELNLRIEELSKELHDYELSVAKDRFLKSEPIKNELDEINNELSDYSEDNVRKYSDGDFREAVNIEGALNSMYSQRRGLEKDIEENEEKLDALILDISNKIGELFDIDKLNQDYSRYENNITKIKELKAKINSGKESISSINIVDIDSFLDNYGKIEDTDRKIEITGVFLGNEDYDKMKSYKSSRIRNSALLVLFAAALTGGVWWSGYQYGDVAKNFIDRYYVMQEPVNTASGIVTAIIAVFAGLTIKPNLNKIKGAKNEIDSMECEFADYTISMNRLNEEKLEIIEETGCKDLDEVVDRFNKLSTEKSLYEEKNKLINYDAESLNALEQENTELEASLLKSLSVLDLQELSPETIRKANDAYSRKDFVKEETCRIKNAIEQLKQSIAKLDKEIVFEEKRLEIILINNGMEDLDSFKDAVDYNEKYTELKNNRDYKESILNKILGDDCFEDLMERTKNVAFYEVKKLDTQAHQLRIFKLNDEKSELSDNVNDILKEIDEIEETTRSLAEVEEEIGFYQNKINTFKKKIKVAEISEDRIIKISDSIKGDFMPLLRKSISDNFSYLTGGKYCEVVIDEDMNITVIEEDNKQRNIDLESLSGGTLDQLYLALRVGLGNILSGNQNIPLIFDDSFVQYDSKRLKNSIEMLAKESERRQIILFTCQEREAELAKQMNIKFNHIKL
mgnify:CR=1 FL=1